ncbi:MAG: hypothetical protein AAF628_02070 [Planctomycetota bacterium]
MRCVFRSVALTLPGLAALLPAADLVLDGRTAVRKLMNDSVQLSVRGGAGLPVWLLADVSPGPTTVFGKTLPIGFSGLTFAQPLGVTDASGFLSFSLRVPSHPRLHGMTLSMVAVVVDPGQPVPAAFDVSNGASLTIVDRNVDLVGHALTEYPFFEHVAAFNEGATVELGIDPTRYPAIAGQTADVYIVANRTRTEWIADRSLQDIAGGPQTMTFVAGDIQANTFTLDAGTLAGPDATPLGGDTRLSVAYDVVIDLNRDGRFNFLDLIDGYDDGEAGMYVVRDTTLGATAATPGRGPHPVREAIYNLALRWPTPVAGSPTSMLRQNTYYPANIRSLGQLPLIVVSHGNGHDYQWYDHVGYHLASYGYVVMSHTNNTVPGTFTASHTTLDNTDAFLGNLSVIRQGVMEGHIDSSKIVWVGHSRGGDGIVRAYDQLYDDAFTMVNYSIDDVRLLSSMAPVQDGGVMSSNPHDVPYHLWVGEGDNNVPGCACKDREQWYIMHDRAVGPRQATSLYGVGHGWFHAQPAVSAWVEGPCQIGEANTHLIMKGYFLPLIRHYLDGDVPARDFLWRQYESFRPIGVPFQACIQVNLQHQEGPERGKWVLDDFQDAAGLPSMASSGAAVTSDLPELIEGLYNDSNDSFTWMPSDPFNGFIMAGEGDSSAGAVLSFDGAGDYELAYTLPDGRRDLSDFEFLSFRAAQTTRHPFATPAGVDLTLTVALVDGSGTRSAIHIGAYGGGVEALYQRNTNSMGCPSCAGRVRGWNNEFETTRIRLGDFLNNGAALDLLDVRQVVFSFGPSWGTAQGRMGLDEIEFVRR